MRLLMRAVEEELGLEPLADQPALHVGEGGEDGIDRRRPATSALSCSTNVSMPAMR